MSDLKIDVEAFNPRVLFALKRKYSEIDGNPYHNHDFLILIYIITGSCTYKISDRLYQVKKGDIVICNPGVNHGKIFNPGEEVTELRVGLNNVAVEGLPKNHLIESDAWPVFSLAEYEQEFIKCCSDIFYEQENNGPGRELLLKINVMKFLATFMKAIYTGNHSGEYSRFRFENYDRAAIVKTLVSFINENYMEGISLDIISRNVYLSPAYISKVFKEETGESPINYLIKVRLAKARELLEDGRLSIKEVAKQVGYNDAYHFSKLYKKYYNIPPSKSRPFRRNA